MKLSELKRKVYEAAKVTTTKQLKAQYPAIRPLDMRCKLSWESALPLAQAAYSTNPDLTKLQSTKAQVDKPENSVGFEDWLSNPPDEYKALFVEADAALTAFDQKLSNTKKLTKTAKAMVASLDEFAEATVEEAQKLASAD